MFDDEGNETDEPQAYEDSYEYIVVPVDGGWAIDDAYRELTRGRARLPVRADARFIVTCIGVGLLAGLMSGLFGVGGGTVIVPLLVLILGFDQRLAAGTSLAAIVPTATVGVISYAVHDSVAWIPALILAVGAVGGAQLGTWLLPRVAADGAPLGIRRLPRRRDRQPVHRRFPRATPSCRSPRSPSAG